MPKRAYAGALCLPTVADSTAFDHLGRAASPSSRGASTSRHGNPNPSSSPSPNPNLRIYEQGASVKDIFHERAWLFSSVDQVRLKAVL